MSGPNSDSLRLKMEMFALSFTALFLEMMVIRWVPSVVHLVAYYANLMLLSSFLGLGAGAICAGKKWRLFGWFPVFVALDIGMLLLDHNAVVGSSSNEARFFSLPPSAQNGLVLVGIFGANALMFVPIGQRMGVIFDTLPRLTAYMWDLAGSLSGTLCFGLFSLKLFSPVIGIAGVMLLYLAIARGRRWFVSVPIFAAVLAAIVWKSDPNAIWSPYYYIVVSQVGGSEMAASSVPADLLTMRDPPIYFVKVNQFGYHLDAALDPSRYTPGSDGSNYILTYIVQYQVPYRICKGRDRAMVVGAGGGFDVEAALESGVKHVDAVEIDPAIVKISHKFSAGAPYSDPRVTVHVDDARSFIAKATPGYDVVAFGYLDSQAMFSNMNNIRLDGYVYTVESIRSAYALLNDKGLLALSFALGRPWLGPKLFQMVEEATGREPAMYLDQAAGGQMILCVSKDPALVMPRGVNRFYRAIFSKPDRMDLPTDDWPFLYLAKKSIPSDYLAAIAGMLAFSILAIGWLRGRSFGLGDVHFGLLGMGFLLLETKSISDSTLFFGTTWFVTMVVVTGVLLMVMLANLVAEHMKGFSLKMYAPLFAILALLIIVPRENILEYSFAGRMLWTLLVVPLPVFFAGIIFSTTFRESVTPAAVFGANLIGAMVGGFCEYLVTAVGNHRLSILVVVAYLGSMLVMASSRRQGRPI
jgi:hypothetical protein